MPINIQDVFLEDLQFDFTDLDSKAEKGFNGLNNENQESIINFLKQQLSGQLPERKNTPTNPSGLGNPKGNDPSLDPTCVMAGSLIGTGLGAGAAALGAGPLGMSAGQAIGPLIGYGLDAWFGKEQEYSAKFAVCRDGGNDEKRGCDEIVEMYGGNQAVFRQVLSIMIGYIDNGANVAGYIDRRPGEVERHLRWTLTQNDGWFALIRDFTGFGGEQNVIKLDDLPTTFDRYAFETTKPKFFNTQTRKQQNLDEATRLKFNKVLTNNNTGYLVLLCAARGITDPEKVMTFVKMGFDKGLQALAGFAAKNNLLGATALEKAKRAEEEAAKKAEKAEEEAAKKAEKAEEEKKSGKTEEEARTRAKENALLSVGLATAAAVGTGYLIHTGKIKL
jgi:hypothetical protein